MKKARNINNKECIMAVSDKFSTTKSVMLWEPIIENKPEDQFETSLFLPEGEGRKGEGGLRTQGYFKKSLPDSPLISVITVAFNAETYLEETIQSVISQTYDNVEYIVIDGGSTDSTLDIIRKYESMIDYWVSEKDEGIYDAMNKGIRASQGQLLGIVNSDDFYEKDACSVVAEAYKNNPDLYLVHGAMRRIDEKGNIDTIYGSKENFSELLMAPFNHPACFFHIEFYKKYGIFDKQFSTASDYDLMLRFKRMNLKEMYVDKILSNFRKGGVTSQSILFPCGQIWSLLRKNKYPYRRCCYGIGYRICRLLTYQVIAYLGLEKVTNKLRKYLSYHKQNI